MEDIAKLRMSFLAEAHRGGPATLYDAIVTDVDSDNFTCDILIDEIPVAGVRLRAIVSDSQSLDILPEVSSAILVGKLDDDDYIVIACDKIALYRVKVGSTEYKIDNTGILLSKGSETLNKILIDLVAGLLSIAAPKDVTSITNLIIRINELLK
ncbi:hypothetical protein [Mucilaginibacter sp.]|uniref:hypothetical protein n=1 Tax=Mucilaginibacter sp. TaxID=1882438 RepID=UPI0025D7CFFB|nr:hypothetical protein [Mucilaginibacter sp.]